MNLLLGNNWSFGTTELIALLGSISTFLAVIVALWQTKSSRKKKLKLELKFVSIFNQHNQIHNHYINLAVANVGNCPVKLSSWYIFIGKTKLFILSTPIEQTTNSNLPLFLNPSEDGSLFLEKDKFIKVLLAFKDEIIKSNTFKTGLYLSTGELITINVKISDLFDKQNIQQVYQYIEQLNIKA